MQMYKIITLGDSFVFCLEGDGDIKPRCDTNEGHIIHLKNSTDYDYILYADDFEKLNLPDLHRAIMTYIYKIRGYPSSEYEIRLENKKLKMTLPDYNGKIGGNVGKCKLLFSNYDNKNGDASYLIKIDKEKYLIIKSDNISCFDEKRFFSRAFTRSYDLFDVHALLIYDSEGEKISFRYNALPERKSEVSSSAFASVCYLLSLLEKNGPKRIDCKGYSALCETMDSGVFVFDMSPKIYKLI